MTRYLNLGGNSNVKNFEIGETHIDVQFGDGSIYRYSYLSAGKMHIEQMKLLAQKGMGLNSYINTKCSKLYESKFRQ